MPEQETIQRAAKDKSSGKSASTQAGEFVREEFHHIREGKHGARSARQAIAIGLSKARRAGVDMPPPKRGRVSEKVRRQAIRDSEKGHHQNKRPSPVRSRSSLNALRHEGDRAASTTAISRQVRRSARHRSAAERSASARRAAHTKTPAGLSRAAHKAARTRKARPSRESGPL